MSENGKGDKPRPISVDRDTFERNWELAFGRKINTNSDDSLSEYNDAIDRLKRQQELKNLIDELGAW